MSAELGLVPRSLSPGQFEFLAQGLTLFLAVEWPFNTCCKEEFKTFFKIVAQYVF